jgi:folate-binding protein YgfZ
LQPHVKIGGVESATEIELDGQYRVVREAAGAFERTERYAIEVAGAEAGEYLQGQLTNDVEALEPGEGCYAALLDRKGHMQADMRVLRLDDAFAIGTESVAAPAVVRHLSMYKIGRDVEVIDRSAELTVVSVIGPAAAELTLGGPLGPEHAHRELDLDGIAGLAVATDLGVDLVVSRGDADRALQVLEGRGIETVEPAVAEIVRVESGRPRFGREMTTATMPQEAGINERAVSFTKGCYIGQETVARLHYKGKPNRRLRGLRLSDAAEAGEPIRLGDRELGQVGTAVLSPRHGRIALAIVRREGEPGATVSVGDGVEAEVVELPF